MKYFYKIIILFFLFIFVNSCGYVPVNSQDKTNFYISEINFNGSRTINNHINLELKKYRNYKKEIKSYQIDITSAYNKIVTNKDDQGDPKNYNLVITTDIKIFSDDGKETNKTFERNTSVSAKKTKITEINEEKKYKKKLASLIGRDIIFFLQAIGK